MDNSRSLRYKGENYIEKIQQDIAEFEKEGNGSYEEITKEEILKLLCNSQGNMIPIRIRESYLRKCGIYYKVIKYCLQSKSLTQTIWMILNDYKEVPTCKLDGCNEKVRWLSPHDGFAECCCIDHANKLKSSIRYRNYNNILNEIYNNDRILEELKTVESFDDNVKIESIKHKKRNYNNYKCKNQNNNDDRFIKMRKTQQMKSVELWKSRGLEIEYVERINAVNGYHIIVKNCCPIHGDVEFTISEFNNRSKRRNESPMCLLCNPSTKNKINGYTNVEYVVKKILDGLNIEYKHKYMDLCNPYETDFFLPKYNIGIECNGIHWHSGLDNYKRHMIKKYIANKRNVKYYFIWEDEAILYSEILKQYLIDIINGKDVNYILETDKNYKYFYCNTHTYERVYDKKDIKSDYNHWELCYIIDNSIQNVKL